jgi:hypothetical protein
MRPIRSLAPAAAALFAFALQAQAAERQEIREVGEFSAIGLAAPVEVHVTQGEAQSVVLEGPAEVLALLETEVEGRTLRIRVKRGERAPWHSRSEVKARITARRVEALAISGSGNIVAASVRGEALKVAISGSGEVRVGGRVEGFNASIAGSGDIRADELDAQRVKVSIAGSGEATVTAREALSVNVAGSGDVRYYGDPSVAQSVMGSGGVRRLGPASS